MPPISSDNTQRLSVQAQPTNGQQAPGQDALNSTAKAGAANTGQVPKLKMNTSGLNSVQKQGLQLALKMLSQNPATARQLKAAADLQIPITFGNEGLQSGAAANTRFTNKGVSSIGVGTSIFSRLTNPKAIAVQMAGALGNELHSAIGVTAAVRKGASLQSMITKQQEAGSFVGDNLFKAVVMNGLNGNPKAPVSMNQIQRLFQQEYGRDLRSVMTTAGVYKKLASGSTESSSLATMARMGMIPQELAGPAQQWVNNAVGVSGNNGSSSAKTAKPSPETTPTMLTSKPTKEGLAASS
jgi:hypothetical protein